MGRLKVLFISLLVVSCSRLHAQTPAQDTILVIGQVVEEESYTGLPFAHVRVGDRATTTDFRGIFRIRVNRGDTVQISYVGYKSKRLVIPGDHPEPLYETKIVLNKDTILLEDAQITLLPSSVEAFKQAILSMDLSEQEYQNVQNNVEAIVRQVNLYNYDKYAMDAIENQRTALGGPRGFDIKGVLNKLRSVLVQPPATTEIRPSPAPVYYLPSLSPDSLSHTDTIFLQRPDTTLRKIDN